MKILIIYGSSEGQSLKISDFVAQILRKSRHEVKILCGKQIDHDISLNEFDAIIVGASIHMGKHPSYITSYAKRNREIIESIPNAFFSVCLAARAKDQASQDEAEKYAQEFFRRTNWEPNLYSSFAGAIRYSRYNLFIRFVMKQIAKSKGLGTDTSRDFEYTDWDSVSSFTYKFLKRLE